MKSNKDNITVKNQKLSETTKNQESLCNTGTKRFTMCVIYFIIILILSRTVFEVGYETTCSMDSTHQEGDIFFTKRVAKDQIKRFDIIEFDHEDEDMQVIKRVIGLPGDEVLITNGKVYVNDILLDETEYLGEKETVKGSGYYCVPEGCYFVLGDNRMNSYDSRYWENPYVKSKDIKRKLTINIYPLNRLKSYEKQNEKARKDNSKLPMSVEEQKSSK